MPACFCSVFLSCLFVKCIKRILHGDACVWPLGPVCISVLFTGRPLLQLLESCVPAAVNVFECLSMFVCVSGQQTRAQQAVFAAAAIQPARCSEQHQRSVCLSVVLPPASQHEISVVRGATAPTWCVQIGACLTRQCRCAGNLAEDLLPFVLPALCTAHCFLL